jgi:hypothetical protein
VGRATSLPSSRDTRWSTTHISRGFDGDGGHVAQK